MVIGKYSIHLFMLHFYLKKDMVHRNILILPLLILMTGINLSVSGQKLNIDSIGIKNLPSIPFLPDPLILDEGGKNAPVTSQAQWQQKKDWIRGQYQHWVSGSVPPSPKTFM